MGRKKTEVEHRVRSLTKIAGGSSYAINIPMEWVRKLDWESKQRLKITLAKGKVTVEELKE